MTNVSLNRKVKELKSQLVGLSDVELNNLLEDTRNRFDGPLTGEDRAAYLELFEAVNRETYGRQDSEQTPLIEAPEALRAEIEGMTPQEIDAALAKSREAVFKADHLTTQSREGKLESERLKHLSLAQTRAREAERMERERELQLQRDKQEALERRRQEAGSNFIEKNALEESLGEFGNG